MFYLTFPLANTCPASLRIRELKGEPAFHQPHLTWGGESYSLGPVLLCSLDPNREGHASGRAGEVAGPALRLAAWVPPLPAHLPWPGIRPFGPCVWRLSLCLDCGDGQPAISEAAWVQYCLQLVGDLGSFPPLQESWSPPC